MKRFTNKLTVAQALGFGAIRVENIANKNPALKQVLNSLFFGNWWWLQEKEIIKRLGKPNVTVKQFESSPGLWVFDDELTGIRFLLWSDCWKKNPSRGTSFEAIGGPKQYHKIDEAFQRLIITLLSNQ